MAELITLARPYAKAAFEHARSAKTLQSWQDSLSQAAMVSKNETVTALLLSPRLTTTEKRDKFLEICGEACGKEQANYIHLLAENKRLLLLPQIAELFNLYKANEEKTVDVEVETAYEISKSLEDTFVKTLKEKLSRDVTLNTKVNKNLIGGAVIRAGDMVIDGSVRGRLAKLAEAINA